MINFSTLLKTIWKSICSCIAFYKYNFYCWLQDKLENGYRKIEKWKYELVEKYYYVD